MTYALSLVDNDSYRSFDTASAYKQWSGNLNIDSQSRMDVDWMVK